MLRGWGRFATIVTMLILLHVIIALISVAYSSYCLISPSKRGFYVTYGLVGATLVSGTYLTISTHTQILSACLTGLAYLSVVSALIAGAHYRLATARAKD